MPSPSLATIAIRSFRFFLRTHSSVVLGIAAATAVIVGALAVGDSVRSSLRELVTRRLSNIECLLQARVFFEPQIVQELDAGGSQIETGIILTSNTVERQGEAGMSRASQVQLLAMDASFWETIDIEEPPTIEADQVALNQALATELSVRIGDELTLIMNDPSGAPSDNPLGKRDDKSVRLPRQTVVAILPDDSVGGVSFRVGQQAPKNVFCSLLTVQDLLECGTKVNAALVVKKKSEAALDGQAICDQLNLTLRPSLEDYALKLERHRRIFPDADIDSPDAPQTPPEVIFDYYQISSDQLILDSQTSLAISKQLGAKSHATVAYVANGIAKIEPVPADLKRSDSLRVQARGRTVGGGRFSIDAIPRNSRDIQAEALSQPAVKVERLSRLVPYSIVVGVDPKDPEFELREYTSVPEEDIKLPNCWINSWLAEQLDVEAGDWIEMAYFEPETVDGNEVEVAKRFMVLGIVPLTEPARGYRRSRVAQFETAPTIFNDTSLTPSVPGITDQDSISNWDVPFKLENKIDAVDDEYWENHRLTPKIFLPYTYASHPFMFGSRFGKQTAIRVPAESVTSEPEFRAKIEEGLLETRGAKGLAFRPIRDLQLKAASGTTPFDVLFLSLSFFVIVAALLLVYLLFKLGLQQRTSELGILQAQGFTAARIRHLLLSEFSFVAIVGSILGIGLGILYARGIIAGLESWWIGAIATRFLSFHASPTSLFLGAFSGFVASLIAIFFGIRKATRSAPLTNLKMQAGNEFRAKKRGKKIYLGAAGIALASAIGMMVAAIGQTGMARAGIFFGSGMLLLVAGLLAVRQWLDRGLRADESQTGSLRTLAWTAICRNPSRSLLSLSLLSVATFLIASMGVFQITPSERGYGGFNLLAQSSQPIYKNIASGSVRSEVLGEEAKKIDGTIIVPMRANVGEDASCNNLFQVSQPTVLGISNRMRELHDFTPDSVAFDWAKTYSPTNPWTPLADVGNGTITAPFPVILDQNTAMWSLKQGGSLGSIIRMQFGERVLYFRTVGLLSNSVLQGKLILSERNFERAFPEISGYSFFLVRNNQKHEPQLVVETLEKGWSNEGLDVQYSAEILANYLGVQNTYISAFQSLGALGLLLGTFGLIAVQVRSVLERKREFAVMRAIGFSPNRLGKILSLETAMLLGGGVAIGLLSATVALIPYVLEAKPSLSFFNPILMLFAIFLIGLIASAIATRLANRGSVLSGLRSE